MNTQPGVRRMFTRHLDNTWSWEAAVWLDRELLFADFIMRSARLVPYTRKKAAEKALQRCLDGIGLGKTKAPESL